MCSRPPNSRGDSESEPSALFRPRQIGASSLRVDRITGLQQEKASRREAQLESVGNTYAHCGEESQTHRSMMALRQSGRAD
jgi:hypothetical protein